MHTGKELGAAIAEAIRLKGVTKTAVADHFGIKGPSVYDWINHGRVSKKHLTAMFDYFSDVVGPEHWGIKDGSFSSQTMGLNPEILGIALTSMDQVIRTRGLHMERQLGKFASLLGYAYEEAQTEFSSRLPDPATKAGKQALREFDKKLDDRLVGGIADGSLGPFEPATVQGAGVPSHSTTERKKVRSR